MSVRSVILLVTATVMACAEPQPGVAASMPDHLPESDLFIETADGRRHAFRVRVAASRRDRGRGLMRVTDLPEDAGMLFDFKDQAMVSMWMKNTPLSLDMIFVLDDGRISSIAGATTPFSRRHIRSEEPVRAVLEIGGGLSDQLNIRAGDQVVHILFAVKPGDDGSDAMSGD